MGKGGLKLKKIRTGLLGILAFVAVFPVAFLVIGSFMGKTELEDMFPGDSYLSTPPFVPMWSSFWILRSFLSCSGIP